MPIHYDTIEDGENKTSHCLMVLCAIYLERKIIIHRYIHVICIITSLEKRNVSILGVCFYRNVRHAAGMALA